MSGHIFKVGVAAAALTLVLSAAAYSRSNSWPLAFAQYQGTERPESPDDFRFVIVGDRTATPEWGLMPKAFEEINHLSPDFVISVGDLIDGYGDKPRVIERLWDEFDAEVATLKSPFVYVPGNHDVWNATSRGIYEARYGPTYRSFNYRGLHFITLDTEQPDGSGTPVDRVTGQQLEWLREDLARNRGARQTLLLMHRPLWQNGGLDEVYPLLAGQRVHIFAGHHHRYSYDEIRGIPHVILSAVAGSLPSNGPVESGCFRHYVFATARGSSLRLAIVQLGGVLGPTIVRAKRGNTQ